jgi:hypothetical protein
MTSGRYTFEFEKIGQIVSVAVKNPGGALVANSAGRGTNAAAQNAAATASDQDLKLTVNQTVFPEL